jgi:hypothetical protein
MTFWQEVKPIVVGFACYCAVLGVLLAVALLVAPLIP